MANLSSSYTGEELGRMDKVRKSGVTRGRFQKEATVGEIVRLEVPGPIPNNPPIPGPWAMVFSDEFLSPVSGTVDPKLWNVLDNSNYGDNPHKTLHRYMARNVVVSDGTCKLICRPEEIGGEPYTSGAISTRAEGSKLQTFAINGRHYSELRMRVSPGGGAWPAFWYRGAAGGSGWPAYGELDVVELYGPNPLVPESNYHYTGGNAGAGHHQFSTPYHDWHTYGVLVAPNERRIQWWYDGKMVRDYTAVAPGAVSGLSEAHTFLINLAIGGAGPTQWHGWNGTWKTGELPLTMELDYVRAWR